MKVNNCAIPKLPTLRPSLPPNRQTVISPDYQREIEKIHSIKTVVDLESAKDVSEVIQNVPKERVCFPKPTQGQKTNLLPRTHQRVSFPLGHGLNHRK